MVEIPGIEISCIVEWESIFDFGDGIKFSLVVDSLDFLAIFGIVAGGGNNFVFIFKFLIFRLQRINNDLIIFLLGFQFGYNFF